jgi:hypothetical protein
MNDSIKYSQIRALIESDKLDEAIDLLKKIVNHNDLLDALILQSAKYSEIKRSKRDDIITTEQANISMAKIRFSLLQLLREVEEDNRNKVFFVNSKNKRISTLIFLFIFSLISSFFIVYFGKLGSEKFFNPVETKKNTHNSQDPYDPKSEPLMFDQNKRQKSVYPETKGKIFTSENNINKLSGVKESQKDEIINDLIEKKPEKSIFPVIQGKVVDNNNKGIVDVEVQTSENQKFYTNKYGFFELHLLKPIENYPSRVYIYYSKDSLQGRELVRIDQKNVIIRFNIK